MSMKFKRGDRVSVTFTGKVEHTAGDGVRIIVDDLKSSWHAVVPDSVVRPLEEVPFPVNPFDRFDRWLSSTVAGRRVPPEMRDFIKQWWTPAPESEESSTGTTARDVFQGMKARQAERDLERLEISLEGLKALHTEWHTEKGKH